jgi:hypothetical protein
MNRSADTDVTKLAKPVADPVKRVHELWAKVRNAKLAARPLPTVIDAKMRAANDFN